MAWERFAGWFGLVWLRTGRSLRHPRRPTTAASASRSLARALRINSGMGSCSAFVTSVSLGWQCDGELGERVGVWYVWRGVCLPAVVPCPCVAPVVALVTTVAQATQRNESDRADVSLTHPSGARAGPLLTKCARVAVPLFTRLHKGNAETE